MGIKEDVRKASREGMKYRQSMNRSRSANQAMTGAANMALSIFGAYQRGRESTAIGDLMGMPASTSSQISPDVLSRMLVQYRGQQATVKAAEDQRAFSAQQEAERQKFQRSMMTEEYGLRNRMDREEYYREEAPAQEAERARMGVLTDRMRNTFGVGSAAGMDADDMSMLLRRRMEEGIGSGSGTASLTPEQQDAVRARYESVFGPGSAEGVYDFKGMQTDLRERMTDPPGGGGEERDDALIRLYTGRLAKAEDEIPRWMKMRDDLERVRYNDETGAYEKRAKIPEMQASPGNEWVWVPIEEDEYNEKRDRFMEYSNTLKNYHKQKQDSMNGIREAMGFEMDPVKDAIDNVLGSGEGETSSTSNPSDILKILNAKGEVPFDEPTPVEPVAPAASATPAPSYLSGRAAPTLGVPEPTGRVIDRSRMRGYVAPDMDMIEVDPGSPMGVIELDLGASMEPRDRREKIGLSEEDARRAYRESIRPGPPLEGGATETASPLDIFRGF